MNIDTDKVLRDSRLHIALALLLPGLAAWIASLAMIVQGEGSIGQKVAQVSSLPAVLPITLAIDGIWLPAIIMIALSVLCTGGLLGLYRVSPVANNQDFLIHEPTIQNIARVKGNFGWVRIGTGILLIAGGTGLAVWTYQRRPVTDFNDFSRGVILQAQEAFVLNETGFILFMSLSTIGILGGLTLLILGIAKGLTQKQ